MISYTATALLLGPCGVSNVQAQTTYAPVVMAAPIEDAVDENHVSLLTGKLHFSIPGVSLGDVSFAAHNTNELFTRAADNNYGYLVTCLNPYASGNGGATYSVTTECTFAYQTAVQAVYGEERATFSLYNGQYSPAAADGSTFVDNGNTCIWTKQDGTQIVYVAFHAGGDPTCHSNNISQVIRPNGRIETYYYYGSFSTSIAYTPSPIISIATNSGYLLKYNYSGTPTWGAETSVVAINRAFETCDPAALSCTLTNTWPTATLAWTPPTGANTFTLIDQANRKHVFGLDGQGRISSYQPPEATTPVYTYALCTLNSDHSMANCFGTTQWTNNPNDSFQQFTVPLLWDLVQTSTRKGQNWQYAFSVQPGTWPNGWSVWQRSVLTPLGTQLLTSGNSTPGTENSYGPTDNVTHYDGTVDHFERNVQNFFLSRQTPRGVLTTYTFTKGASPSITKTPVSGSPIYPQTVTYPTCTNSFVCYKPITVQDANGNTGTLTYDPVHGGVLTATGPTVNTPQANGVQPQTRHTYVQRNAWYLSSSGLMTRDTNPIWVLATESYCRMGGAISPPGPPGAGCTLGNDEVVTTYEYGPDSGPNNLLLRGKSVAADGQTLRSCYGHDKQGNKIWETTPNAQPSSCPSY